MLDSILGIVANLLQIGADWFKSKQSPAMQASATAKKEQQIDEDNTKAVQDAIKTGDPTNLEK